MGNLSVAVIGPLGYSKDLGKKGTSSDITLYDVKKGQTTVTLLEPSKYPERISSLFFCVSMADMALVVVDEIDSALGECLVTLDCMGISKGMFVLRNYLSPDRMQPFIKGTIMESYTFVADDPISIRETLLTEAAKIKEKDSGGKGVVPIDHHFNVKGVGTVILGYVASGIVKRHDTMQILPTAKTALVRSIQKHDDDFDIAYEGDRVGLALKNVDSEELDRGYVLSTDPDIIQVSELERELNIGKYWQVPIKEGMVLHLGQWMQFIPSRVESVRPGKDVKSPIVKLKIDKPLVHRPGSRILITYLEGGKLRVVGTIIT